MITDYLGSQATFTAAIEETPFRKAVGLLEFGIVSEKFAVALKKPRVVSASLVHEFP